MFAPLRRSTALRTLALAALLAAPAAAGVITVAKNGSGDFTSINTAVLAAADGDTIVVHGGNYGPFTVGGNKSVAVVWDGGGIVTIEGPIGVLNGAAGKSFTFVGLNSIGNVGSGGQAQGYGFWARNTAGSIRVQDCSFTGAAGDPNGWSISGGSFFQVTGHAAGWHGVWLQDNTGSIAFNDCSITGGHATPMVSFPSPDCGCTYGEPGGHGVSITNSNVVLADCDAEAGNGSPADRSGGTGGSGVRLDSGSVVLSGGSFEAGNGGSATDYIGEVFGGDGGHGLFAAPGATAWVQGSLLAGGGGGMSLSGDDGDDGQPISGPAAVFSSHVRSLSGTSPAYTGGQLTLTFTGQPGDVAMLFLSTTPGLLPVSKYAGALLESSALVLPLGALPPSGQLVLQSPVPSIAPLLELPVFVQGLAGVPGDASFTGAVALVIVDPAAL